MRKLGALVLLLVSALPAGASKGITVEQLQQALSAARGKPDGDVAQQLSDLELSERISPIKLAQLRAGMPGEMAQQALTEVADRAEFLNLPAAEIPAIPPPTQSEQRQIMSLVVTYVTRSVHQLPNFFATRETTRFEDRPQVNYSYLPLHFVGNSARSVVYRDGQEMVETAAGKPLKGEAQEEGLVSWGEFGPILSTVLLDAAQSKLAWSHWELGANGPEAVFSYEVPSQKSHYLVQSESVSASDLMDTAHEFRERPGYHGEMKIDPATGSILRVTVDAALALGDPLTRAAIMVEYGTVDIGGKAVICPKRSVALSVMRYGHATSGAHSVLDHDPLKTLLNDVEFGKYHQLRSEMRILTDGEAAVPIEGSGTGVGLQPLSAVSAEPAKPTEITAPTAVESNSSMHGKKVEESASGAGPEGSAPAPSSMPAEPEISVGAAGNIPDTPVNSSVSQPASFVLKVASRLVDVGVVVVDKKGQPVGGLKAQDFDVYDNGRRQEVKFFNAYATNGISAGALPSASAVSDGSAGMQTRTYSNQPTSVDTVIPPSSATATSTTTATAGNTTVLLIDESHISWGDLSNARGQILKFLQGLAPEEKVGLYTISGRGFRVLTEITSDHAAVIARLKKWMPTAQSASNAQEDETRNRQQIETVHNASDLKSVNGNQAEAPDGQTPIDPQLLTMGSNPGRASLIILLGVARHLASVPGHKNLVWIASDNVLVDWTDQAVAVDKNTTSVDAFAIHAQEAMNEAHVAVYPFDVSQLEAGGIGADTGNRNVELAPAAKEMGNGPRELDAGRTKASMLQDLRPIQGPIRQVADATGGQIIRRSSDMVAELRSIVEDGHATYQVGFYPDTPADGQYHTVLLKLVDKKGLTVRGRSGYLYAKEPTTLKERFRQAIWQPADAAEIKVTATVDDGQPNRTIKINMAATDLAPELRGGRWMDKLDIFFVQRDDAGMHADLEGQTLGLRLKQATYDKLVTEGVPFEHAVTLKPGTGSVRVLVVDENSGRMGSVTLPGTAFQAQ
jgi:VWFA-related protein